MKTVLLNIFDSNVARNILRTDVFRVLASAPDIKLVVLVPSSKFNDYSAEFSRDNVIIEMLPDVPSSRIENMTISACWASMHTHSVRQLLEMAWRKRDKRGRLRYLFLRLLSFLGRFKVYRKIARLLFAVSFNDAVFDAIFQKYQLDFVFSCTIYATNDIRLIKCAKRRGVIVVGMIKSWDNLTSKDFLLIQPDFLIVHNEIIKKDAVKIGDYPERNIFVSGIPQFDKYVAPDFLMTREEFFNKFGLDLNKKLILLAAVGSWLFPREREAIEVVAEIVSSGLIASPVQILVRLHPAYLTEDESLKNIQNIVIHRPGKIDFLDPAKLRSTWEFDEEETRILGSTLKWSDVTINCGSTMTVEAALFDKPIINLNFDGRGVEKNYWDSVRKLYRREHYVPLVLSGGISFPDNKEELVRDINYYLKDPAFLKEGRKKIVDEQCYKADGQAGKRIAEFILEKLN